MLSDISPADFWSAAAPRAQDHQLGHRDRLRRRVKVGGFDPLPDYELLELILFRSFPRGDVKPLAKTLVARFGSLAAVFGASVAELCSVKGVGEAAALDIRAVQEAARYPCGPGGRPSDHPRARRQTHGDIVLERASGLRPRRPGP